MYVYILQLHSLLLFTLALLLLSFNFKLEAVFFPHNLHMLIKFFFCDF